MKEAWQVKRLGELGAPIREQAKIAATQEYELWSVPSFETGTPETSLGKDIGSAKLRVRPNDVLICKINPRINRVWLVSEPMNGREQVGSTEWLVFRANPNSGLSPHWLIHFVSAPRFREWIASDVSGATGSHTRAKTDGILQQEIPVPPLAEQRRIVGVLDDAFVGVATAEANAEANLQNARALFESHLQSVFSKRGKGWVEKRLEEIGKTQTGSTPKTSDQSNYGDFIPFVKPADFNADGSLDCDKDGLSKSGLANARVVPAGSALMVCIGATIGKCGYCDQDVTTNQQINALTPRDGSSHRFLYYQMLTASFQRSVIQNSGQATLPIINKSKWSALPVWLPPTVGEQKRIAAQCDALVEESQRLATLYKRKLAALDALKKSLLHEAFTGRL